jgi:hypothetical protein
MEKVIKIGKQEVKLSNNVASTMEYRDQFGKDVVQEHVPLLASLTEGLATVVSDTGKTEGITVADILEAVEGRSMEILIPLMQTEFMSVIVNVTWAMAKAADEDIAPPKQWVRQFDVFPVDVIAPVIYEMALKGFVSSKNLKRLKKLGKDLQNLQPSHSTQSSSPASNED